MRIAVVFVWALDAQMTTALPLRVTELLGTPKNGDRRTLNLIRNAWVIWADDRTVPISLLFRKA